MSFHWGNCNGEELKRLQRIKEQDEVRYQNLMEVQRRLEAQIKALKNKRCRRKHAVKRRR